MRVWPANGLVVGVALSLLAHTAALTFFIDRMNRAGVEAPLPPVDVAIMVETALAAAEPTYDGAPSTEAAETLEPVEDETAVLEAAPPETVSQTIVVTESLTPTDSEVAPPTEAAPTAVAAMPDAERSTPAIDAIPILSATRSASAVPLTPEATLTQTPPELPRVAALPPVKLVTETPRRPPRAKKPPLDTTKPELRAPKADARPAPQKRTTGRETQTASLTSAGAAGKSVANAAKASASAGSPAQYGRKLLGHVERHKRYPAAAASQRMTGATRLSITIDRSGGLAGARVSAGSGHAILDQEALAVARRAAPYPKPPEGVGGRTFTFAVTLRFRK